MIKVQPHLSDRKKASHLCNRCLSSHLVHLFDRVDHSNSILSEDKCREHFLCRVVLQRDLDVRNQLDSFLSRRFGGGAHCFGSKRQEIVESQVFDSDERSETIRECLCAGYS